MREPASFWRENVIAIVILLKGFSENVGGEKKLSNVRNLIIFQSAEGLASSNRN